LHGGYADSTRNNNKPFGKRMKATMILLLYSIKSFVVLICKVIAIGKKVLS